MYAIWVAFSIERDIQVELEILLSVTDNSDVHILFC